MKPIQLDFFHALKEGGTKPPHKWQMPDNAYSRRLRTRHGLKPHLANLITDLQGVSIDEYDF